MIADAIKFVLSHIPLITFVAAFAVAFLRKNDAPFQTRLLNWLLLLSVGVEATWAGFFHVCFPRMAAASIGWEVSPFQFEIGVADMAIGIVAIRSFWRSLDFKAAVVGYTTLFYIGVAGLHIREALAAGNTSGNNFGTLLAVTVAKVFLLPILYTMAKRISLGSVAIVAGRGTQLGPDHRRQTHGTSERARR